MTDTVLSVEQVEAFVEHGYVKPSHCFTREDAQPWLDEAWVHHRGTARFSALGVERLDYGPAAPREDVVPERVRRQERMRAQEEARLAEARS